MFIWKTDQRFHENYEIFTIERECYLFCLLLPSVQLVIETSWLRGCLFVMYDAILQ